jgi:hypothetical protein
MGTWQIESMGGAFYFKQLNLDTDLAEKVFRELPYGTSGI